MTEPMTMIQELKTRILNGGMISREEALALYEAPLEELCSAARQIQLHFCQNRFDLCTIINGKSGRCPENCRFCAQSAYSSSSAEEYPLLDADTIVQEAGRNHRQGVPRFSIVTSGRQLNDREVDRMCLAIQRIRKETGCLVCASFGLLTSLSMKTEGSRCHPDPQQSETSRSNFPNVCTTHTFDQKLAAIKAAQAAGLTVCSGGIVGMGETPEDQVDMALSLRELGIRSVPVNMLNPIPGTPLGHLAPLTGDQMRRIVAVFRFLLPDAFIRLAGGRGLLPDKGRSCFLSGANAAISGDMLTTSGISTAADLQMLSELGCVL
ncbi:MAG: biotin synthase BioB [Enterocloster sp.]